MPVSCVAYGCTNRYTSGQTISFFSVTCSMIENESEHNYSHKYPHSILVDDVVVIVKFIESTLIQLTSNFCSLLPGLSQKVILGVKNHVYNYNIFNSLNCKQYLKVRLHYVAKLKTSADVSKRLLLTKLILFNYQ
ncbi:Uncharacterized protein FWK35_00035018 [Aphis craccivora]|uniref:Uncharacterized protein n=1 Tax=Aphis craccivora TaxID=307492 RepID=A0A6G0VPK9_APHCR|nr:Uncharacterized protein FWK35_00035018 [Aphis craccivora]